MKGIIDSTLREGAQTVGVSFSLKQKKQIMTGLFRVGVEEIELGVSTPHDTDLKKLISFARQKKQRPRLAIWCRCRKDDIDHAASLRPDVLSLSIPGSDLHIQKKLGKSRQWVLKMIDECVTQAKGYGVTAISLGVEDATRADSFFLQEMIERAVRAGAQRIRLADTVGIASPAEMSAMVRKIKSRFSIDLGVHCHNDFGMASANSLAALDSGADWLDVTVLGLGERAGNAKLEEVVGYLTIRRQCMYMVEAIVPLAELVAALSRRAISPHHPLLGSRIFHSETGLHLQGLASDPRTYEPYSPELVGASRQLFFGSKIGKHEVQKCLNALGVQISNSLQDKIVSRVRNRSVDGRRPFNHKEFIQLVSQVD